MSTLNCRCLPNMEESYCNLICANILIAFVIFFLLRLEIKSK